MDRNPINVMSASAVQVALRKESVDRNINNQNTIRRNIVSLSARRAWIEIGKSTTLTRIAWVALRKESVDRNQININTLVT